MKSKCNPWALTIYFVYIVNGWHITNTVFHCLVQWLPNSLAMHIPPTQWVKFCLQTELSTQRRTDTTTLGHVGSAHAISLQLQQTWQQCFKQCSLKYQNAHHFFFFFFCGCARKKTESPHLNSLDLLTMSFRIHRPIQKKNLTKQQWHKTVTENFVNYAHLAIETGRKLTHHIWKVFID